jgi:hypothetical protein
MSLSLQCYAVTPDLHGNIAKRKMISSSLG